MSTPNSDLNGPPPPVSQVPVSAGPSEHATPPRRGDPLGSGEAVADVSQESCSCHGSHYIYIIGKTQAQPPTIPGILSKFFAT